VIADLEELLAVVGDEDDELDPDIAAFYDDLGRPPPEQVDPGLVNRALLQTMAAGHRYAVLPSLIGAAWVNAEGCAELVAAAGRCGHVNRHEDGRPVLALVCLLEAGHDPPHGQGLHARRRRIVESARAQYDPVRRLDRRAALAAGAPFAVAAPSGRRQQPENL
jgi:hypothetical protein